MNIPSNNKLEEVKVRKNKSQVQRKSLSKKSYASEKPSKPPITKKPSSKQLSYGNMNRYRSHKQLSKNSQNKNVSADKKVASNKNNNIRRVSSLAKDVNNERRNSKDVSREKSDKKKIRQDYLSRIASREKVPVEKKEYSSKKVVTKERSASKKSAKDSYASRKSYANPKSVDSRKDIISSKKREPQKKLPKSRMATPAKEQKPVPKRVASYRSVRQRSSLSKKPNEKPTKVPPVKVIPKKQSRSSVNKIKEKEKSVKKITKIPEKRKVNVPIKSVLNKPPPLRSTQKSNQINQSINQGSQYESYISNTDYDNLKVPRNHQDSYLSVNSEYNLNYNEPESQVFIKKKSFTKQSSNSEYGYKNPKSYDLPPIPKGNINENKYSGFSSKPNQPNQMLQYNDYIKQMQERNMRRKNSQKKLEAMNGKFSEGRVYRSRVSSAEIHKNNANKYYEQFGQKPSWYG